MSTMSAMKVGRTPSLGGGPRVLSRTQAILLETMQLVEPRKSLPVPNHLLESKIYSKIAGNSVVQARPAVVHFSGFELGTLQTAVLRLGNVSTEVQRMHIIPPQTKYFNIKYTKNDRLVPGLTLDCVIEFIADEWRYFYDCIRIHCKGEENLVIPIHAYPVMGTDEFPKNLNFPPVPVGHRSEQVIPLRCNAPVDFEFQLSYLQPHPAITVQPMAGLVPAQGEVDLVVTFSPTEFSTAHMKLQLVISQFNSRPLVCTVTGSSLPGLAKQIAEAQFGGDEDEDLLLDPRSITPVERARSKRKAKNRETTMSVVNVPKEVEKAGIRFPSNLDTPFAVGQVLNQEPGKLRIKDIREAVLAKKGEVEASTRQMKEAMFEMAVRKDVYEERQNQLRWQSKIGDDQINLRQKYEILEARKTAWEEYKLERGDPVPEKEALRTCTECSFRRTIRDAANIGQDGVKFDTYTNDLWAARHSRLWRFQQAARTIIIRKRADKKIKGLRQMVLDWSKKKFNPAATPGGEDEEEEEVIEEDPGSRLQMTRVTSVTFPTYVEPNVKDDMAVDALGAVPYKPTEVVLPKKTPFFNLKVPQQYSLMGYDMHNVHEAAATYVPPNLVKELRTGAEDEIINLAPPALREPPPEDEPVNEGDMRVESVADTHTSEPISLRPPEALFKPIEYPPLHIFNPAPGLQVFQAPLPYAEVDPDFHLCPLPRYTAPVAAGPHAATQKTYLDREDVIRGVMAWKKFPSQGLTSLASTPTLTNVWVPRWSDPFVSDLLPTDTPPLLDGLGPVDDTNITEEDDEEAGVALTPEMVNAQFTLVDRSLPAEEKPKQKDITDESAGMSVKSHYHSQHHQKLEDKLRSVDLFPHGNKLPATNVPVSHHGPVPRDQRESELDHFMKKKYNRVGAKISQRIEQLNTLKSNNDLVLK